MVFIGAESFEEGQERSKVESDIILAADIHGETEISERLSHISGCIYEVEVA